MLSYQHAFHAGNHADILKHFILTFVLNSLNKKDKPYTFFDTHSASGLYDLMDNRSLKTGEAEKGILSFMDFCNGQSEAVKNLGESFNLYFDYVSSLIKDKMYPGSPKIESHFIRTQDFLVLSELHPQEVENLKRNLHDDSKNKSIQIHHRNGFEMLKALTPPVTKRGAVLIDPSYEEVQDYKDVADYVSLVNKKWSNGIIMIWYPLLAHRQSEIDQMVQTICNNARKNNQNIEIENLILQVADKNSHKEVSLEEVLSDETKKNPPRLYGSGMLVLNAPWHLKEETEKLIDFSSSFFYQNGS